MTTVLSPSPIQKFFDNNGQPLANGLLFTYKAGTSTKQATFVDSTGGTPNTNPIVLDYRGECRLWIDPTLAYKFVLAPSTDTDPPSNPFWSVDNISAFGLGLNFDLTAVDTGSVNAIAVSIPTLPSPVAFSRIVVKVANTNTGATTITANGGTAKAVTLENIAALSGGELLANGIYQFIFDGAEWILQSPALHPPQLRTAAENAASVTPVNFFQYPGTIYRQGTNTTPGTTDLTTAITNNNSQAKQSTGAQPYFPRDTYLYKPSATILVGGTNSTHGAGWRGDDAAASILSVNTATLGAGTYIQSVSDGTLSELQFRTVGGATTGNIVKLSNDTASQFTGNQHLTRVWVIGGSHGFDLGNLTVTTFDQCRVESATVGEFCNPDSSAGGGYVTTLLHLNCLYHGNAQNINYNCTVNSMSVAWIGGSIEDSTGASPQASFTNVSTLSFHATYSEGNSGQPWLSCTSVGNLSVTGHTNNGAGTLSISDNNTFVAVRSCAGSGAGNTITAGGTTNRTYIESSQFATTGNTMTGERTIIVNSDINGIKHGVTTRGSASAGVQSIAANGPAFIRSQRTNVTGAGATDVFRWLNDISSTSGTPVVDNTFTVVEISAIAIDNSSGANFATYKFIVSSGNNLVGSAQIDNVKTNQRLLTGGTDPGASANPFTLANDGAGGAVKLQFTKNAAIASNNVRVDVVAMGVSTA